MIFISHKLHEVRAITNRVVILRQGRGRRKCDNDGTISQRRLAELMCGRDVRPPAKRCRPGAVLLQMDNLQTQAGHGRGLKGVCLNVHAGEILGIAGVSGNGQRELADVVAGVLPPSGGRLEINGQTG